MIKWFSECHRPLPQLVVARRTRVSARLASSSVITKPPRERRHGSHIGGRDQAGRYLVIRRPSPKWANARSGSAKSSPRARLRLKKGRPRGIPGAQSRFEACRGQHVTGAAGLRRPRIRAQGRRRSAHPVLQAAPINGRSGPVN